MLLKDKVVLITGAGQGNGAAIAHGLAREGATIVSTDIDEKSASRTADEIIANGGRAFAWRLDVTDPASCSALADCVRTAAGAVSVLVNNAGICPRNTVDSPDVRESWDAAMKVNLDGTLNVTLAFLAQLRETHGTIINMASIASFVSTSTSISYSTSKAAVRMLTQNLAQELAKDGVRVNAIAPGTFATPMTDATRNDPERSKRFLSRIPLGRFGEPEELVGPTLFLASDMSSYMTGATVVVDGGYLAV